MAAGSIAATTAPCGPVGNIPPSTPAKPCTAPSFALASEIPPKSEDSAKSARADTSSPCVYARRSELRGDERAGAQSKQAPPPPQASGSQLLLRAASQGATTHAENDAWGVCVSTDVAGWLARWLAEWLAADRAERRIPSAASPSVSGVLRCVT